MNNYASFLYNFTLKDEDEIDLACAPGFIMNHPLASFSATTGYSRALFIACATYNKNHTKQVQQGKTRQSWVSDSAPAPVASGFPAHRRLGEDVTDYYAAGTSPAVDVAQNSCSTNSLSLNGHCGKM